MRNVTKLKFAIGLAILVALTVGTLALAARPGPRPHPVPGACPNLGIYCLDVWDPVTCDNGVTYSNQCYADRACATGCTPGGATQ